MNNDRLFMYCCVIGTILFTIWGSQVCWNQFDEFLILIFALAIMMLPFMFKKAGWLDK